MRVLKLFATSLRVTPDPERAAELQRRIDALQYRPEAGFHRDRLQQPRVDSTEALPIRRRRHG